MSKTLVEKYVEDSDQSRLFQQERAIYEATATLEELMEAKGVSRADLARRLGRSKGWVTQLLDGEANKTIRTVADAFAVLGHEFHSSSRPIQISNAQPARPADAQDEDEDDTPLPVILSFELADLRRPLPEKQRQTLPEKQLQVVLS